jgi:ribitol-5-phosphate 2-dehydrogenase (NADP+) / D-ribitol-5-phosphate cytidylyltransferase
MKTKFIAVLLLSGDSKRLQTDIPKQFSIINDKYLFQYSLETFQNNDNIDEIILVVHPSYLQFVKEFISPNKLSKVSTVIKGGITRQESSFIGLSSIASKEGCVLIHDAARPFISSNIIDTCCNILKEYEAVVVTTPLTDTLYKTESGIVSEIPERKYYQLAQTPQCFRIDLIKKAHQLAHNDQINDATDDCSLVLKYKLADIKWLNGNPENIKITYSIDFELARIIVEKINPK